MPRHSQGDGSPRVELLAPAGSMAALHAAIMAGADAVYLGLEEFNARRNADNFGGDAFAEACDYAHLRGARIYVALNTILLPSEVTRALECARQAYRMGADAFIVQDIGLAAELARTLPQARLHISTQMNTHNVAGIQAAARLGAHRVTLARELSLAEIAHLATAASELGLEVESFAHGALCVCYSGQCFMSSMIGGRSANRGLCAQACRLPYRLHNAAQRSDLPSPGDHLLSPQDLCAIDLLPDLVDAGVGSLKIEGRMKSADYVYAVTAAYRAVLDRAVGGCRKDGLAAPSGQPDSDLPAAEDERRALEEVFSRGFSTAYLTNERGNDMMSYGRPNNRGVFIGRVASVRDGVAALAVDEEVHEGDVLEFWTNKGHFAHTLAAISRERTGLICTSPERPVGKGDRVFRVRNAAAAFVDDPLMPRIPVAGSITLRVGQPLHMEFRVTDESRCASAAVGAAEGSPVESARTKAVTLDDVRSHVDRLGQTPFVLSSLEVILDDNVGIGFSQIHRIRAEALEDLRKRLLMPFRDRVLPRVRGRERIAPVRKQGCDIVAWASNPACARAAKRGRADAVYVPALNYKRGQAVVVGVRSDAAEQAGYPKQCVTALPTVDHDLVLGTREEQRGFDPWRYASSGKPVLVDNLGDLVRAADEGVFPEVGPHVPITNQLSLKTAADLGAQRVWLSPELTLGQIADLAQDAPVALGLAVMGAQELMICEHCLLMSQGPCDERCDVCRRRSSPHYLSDRKGYKFPVVTDVLGRGHLYNAVPLDIVSAMPDLIAAGVSAFMVDTTLMSAEEACRAVGRAVRARDLALRDGNAVAKVPDTTTGHLFRGVS